MRGAVFVAVLVVLSGCAGFTDSQPTTSVTTTTATPTTVSTSTDTATTTTSSTPTTATTTTTTTSTTRTTTAGPVANPWGREEVTVGVVNLANNRSITPLVEQALSYWENNTERYGTYPVDYVLVNESTQDADIVVRFVSTIEDCGHDTDLTEPLGCAPLLTADTEPRRHEYISIRAGYIDESTLATIKHEFGHTLGLTHDDEPQPLMAAYGDADKLPIRNASELDYPWHKQNLTIYVETGEGWSYAQAERETDKLIEYYNDGAQGWLTADVEFTYADSRDTADIVIRYDNSEDCGYAYGGACGRTYGFSTDADPALEYYSEAVVVVTDVETDSGGWFAATQLAYTLGAEKRGVPYALEDQERADGEWYR